MENRILSIQSRRAFLVTCASASSLSADVNPDWTEPFIPHRIADNLYYVGSKGLASFLITTPEGHILINSNLESSVPQIRSSIEKLGFQFNDVKILLISHAHWDHCAGSSRIKSETRAKYMVMEADIPDIETGGKSNFRYSNSPETFYPPVKVDRALHDGDDVALGGIVLTARLTPGHTKGCTTWLMQAVDHGKSYRVVIVGSPNVNSGYKLVNNNLYPQIASDYERTFRTLKSLPCDIFLGAHGDYYGLAQKFPRLKSQNGNPFIDPAGYRSYVADRGQAFRADLTRQRG